MKRDPVLMGTIGGISIFILSSALFIHARLSVSKLDKELKETRANLSSAYQAKENVDSFEKTKTEFTRKDKDFSRTIPLNEKEPLELIKELMLLAKDMQITNPSFSIKKRKMVNLPQLQSFISSLSEYESTTISKVSSQAGASTSKSEASMSAGMQGDLSSQEKPGLYFFPIRMDLEADFSNLLKFLNKILSLKRVITIEDMKIARSSDISPRQKITLTIYSYTLVSP